MRKTGALVLFVSILFFVFSTTPLSAADNASADDDMGLQSVLSKLKLAGGISGGYFYASNPGKDASGSEFLLSNLLVEISSADETVPIGFAAGFGQTSTPSVLDTPENTTTPDIEYAYLTVSPIAAVSLEVGLLLPNSGFENTYTYGNKNILLGAVASQQPYNAYGAKLQYEVKGISLWGGYYKQRLDDEEYNSPDEAWEIGACTSFFGNEFSLYHYHIDGQRSMTGVSIEWTIRGVDIGANIDYWTWESPMKDIHESDPSLGGAVYVNPNFGRFSIPIRLEYIHHEESGIYVETAEAKRIITATITPTYHYSENAYTRVEAAYVNADGAFEDENGGSKDSRVSLAVEVGYLF